MSDALKKFDSLNTWKRRGERAPHKPLLCLLALGRLQRGETGKIRFNEIESSLAELLREFGPTRQKYEPRFPFWALQKNGIWIVESDEEIETGEGPLNWDNYPSADELKEKNATGRLPDSIIHIFNNDPDLITHRAEKILSAHFPESLHQDISNAVGINLNNSGYSNNNRRRDPRFRKDVLLAYEYKCAICGMDIHLSLGGSNSLSIGLEAAHIKWHQAGGEDVPSNGLALCSLHHKLLDHGAYTILDDYRVLVSERARGGDEFNRILMSYHGSELRKPLRKEQKPAISNLIWHRKEVFKKEGRELN